MKICKNGNFRHISGILDRKKIFLQNRTRSYFEHCQYAFLCKKSEKTNDEISRKCQKTGFSGIFPAFSAGKICFLKIGLGHILDIAILHQCAKFHEKILSTAREIQEIPFFRRKSAVPAIFRKFRLQKSVLLTIKPWLMVGIVITNVFA